MCQESTSRAQSVELDSALPHWAWQMFKKPPAGLSTVVGLMLWVPLGGNLAVGCCLHIRVGIYRSTSGKSVEVGGAGTSRLGDLIRGAASMAAGYL